MPLICAVKFCKNVLKINFKKSLLKEWQISKLNRPYFQKNKKLILQK